MHNTNVFLKILKKIFLLFIIVFILDFLTGSLLKKLYFQQKTGQEYKLNNTIEKVNADILIFGSSTASHDYSPAVFEKLLHKSCYDVGLPGSSIFYHYAILSAMIKRYHPQTVLLNFDMQEFKKEAIFYDRLSVLLPYYKKHPEVDSIVNLKSSHERLKLFSKIYPYNSLIYKLITDNNEVTKKDDEENNGYIPLSQLWDQKIKNCSSLFLDYEVDTSKIKVYEGFIKKCIENKIQLYIFSSPIFCNYDTSKSIVIGRQIANKYKIKFFDYSKDSMFLDNQHLFSNTIEHLNDSGAKIFSKKIIDDISAKSRKTY